jgi:hypothetical protein
MVNVPLLMRERVERLLVEFGLHEVAETWPVVDEDDESDPLQIRSVLTFDDGSTPDEDELLRELRHAWRLELNVDPENNVDEAGRELGSTLWQATMLVESVTAPHVITNVSIWATASSLAEIEELIEDALEHYPTWRIIELDTIDRVAFDERPDALVDLPPRRSQSAVHLVEFDPALASRETVEGGGPSEGHEYG